MNTAARSPQIRFSLVGSLRSGSSLLARCLDDHPEAICLCESEINRTLFPRHHYLLHFRRMRNHGLEPEEIMQLLDGKQHYNTAAYELSGTARFSPCSNLVTGSPRPGPSETRVPISTAVQYSSAISSPPIV